MENFMTPGPCAHGTDPQEPCDECNASLIDSASALRDALDYLLAETVDKDLEHGVGLTEGEDRARKQALEALAQAAGEETP